MIVSRVYFEDNAENCKQKMLKHKNTIPYVIGNYV